MNLKWIEFEDDGPKGSMGDGERRDRLLDCLVHISKTLGRETSRTMFMSGIALGKDGLTPGNIEVVAKNGGLQSNIIARQISKIDPVLYPCILLLANRSCCVLYERAGTKCRVYQPDAGEEPFEIELETLEKSYIGHAIPIKPEYSHIRAQSRNQDFKGHWFWSVLKDLRPQYLKVVVASLIVNSFAIAAPLFMLNVYDRVLPNSAFSTLWVLATGMFLVLGFDLILRLVRSVIIDKSGRWADVKLASRIMDHVLRMKMSEKPAASGAFASRLRDFETVREFFSSATLLALLDIVFIVLFLLVIWMVGGPMVIIPSAAVVVVIAVALLIQPVLIKSIQSVQEETALKHGLLIEAINGLDTIKSLNAEGSVLRKWEELADTTSISTEKIRFLSMNIITFTMIVQQLVAVLIIIYGTYLFDMRVVTMGAIIATVLLASRAVAPLGVIASTLARLQQSLVALKNLNDIMATETENTGNDGSVSREITRGNIDFRNISFSYPGTEIPALNDVSFKIESGDKIGIIGKVGAGKSTLSQLIAGLYEADSGNVAIDGINISQIHTTDLRNSIGYVLQQPVLFSGTIAENIAYGRHGLSDQEIIQAAVISGAIEFINQHPLGFGAPVGEGGRFLSGGQRQLVALARALVTNPPILLLDEPTSAMDNGSEAMLMDKLAKLQGKTIIICTHRQSLLNIVDKLILMDSGKLVAFGKKADVLNLIRNMIAKERQPDVKPNPQKAEG